MDMAPSQNMLAMQYLDGPGRLGRICPILGDAGINISTMQVSLKDAEDDAIVVLNLDVPCPDSVRDQLIVALGEFDLHETYFMHL